VIHSDWASAYGVTGDLSRETLPIARRLAMVEEAGGRDLPPDRRTPGTCRDFALMTCSALRERDVPARVRCGFATYFPSNPFEDHWVCEHWREDEKRWVLTDAQLDPTAAPAPARRLRSDRPAGEDFPQCRRSVDDLARGRDRRHRFRPRRVARCLVPAGEPDARPVRPAQTGDVRLGFMAIDCGRQEALDDNALAEGDQIAAKTGEAGHTPP